MTTRRPSMYLLVLVVLLMGLLTACGTTAQELPAGAETPVEQEAPDEAAGDGPARLRITNNNDYPLDRVVVFFAEEQFTFENIAPGAMSEYQVAEKGVYSYAGYDITVEGESYAQLVTDWMFDEPQTSGDFTYAITYTPGATDTAAINAEVIQSN